MFFHFIQKVICRFLLYMISSHIFLKNQTAHWQTLRRRLKQKLEVNPKLLLDIIHERLLRRNRAAIALNHVLQCHAGAELPQICRHLIPQALLYRCFQKRVVICTANIHIAQNCDVQCVNDLLKCDLAGRSCDDIAALESLDATNQICLTQRHQNLFQIFY